MLGEAGSSLQEEEQKWSLEQARKGCPIQKKDKGDPGGDPQEASGLSEDPPSPGYRPVACLYQLFAVIFFQQLLQGRCILCGQVESEASSKLREHPTPPQ